MAKVVAYACLSLLLWGAGSKVAHAQGSSANMDAAKTAARPSATSLDAPTSDTPDAPAPYLAPRTSRERTPAARPAPAKPERTWYGEQVLLTGGAAGTALAVSLTLYQLDVLETVPALLFVPYLFSGPVVHMVHGNAVKAFGSLGLNLLTPFASWASIRFAGLFLDGDCWLGVHGTTGQCVARDVAGYAAIASFVVSPLLDAFMLAYDQDEPGKRRRSVEMAFVPRMSDAHAGTLGGRLVLSGRF